MGSAYRPDEEKHRRQAELALRWINGGDEDALAELMRGTFPLFSALARKFPEFEFEEAVEIARVRVFRGMHRFDPSRGKWGAFACRTGWNAIATASRAMHAVHRTNADGVTARDCTLSLDFPLGQDSGDGTVADLTSDPTAPSPWERPDDTDEIAAMWRAVEAVLSPIELASVKALAEVGGPQRGEHARAYARAARIASAQTGRKLTAKSIDNSLQRVRGKRDLLRAALAERR